MGWIVHSTPPAALPPGKTRYPPRWRGGPQGRSGRVRKISPPTGIRSPDRLVRSESLYRLSYPDPRFLIRLFHKCQRSKTVVLKPGCEWRLTRSAKLARNLMFVVPCIMLYNCEISPTRCNNCVLFFAMALLYMFPATISPIIRSIYAVYGHR